MSTTPRTKNTARTTRNPRGLRRSLSSRLLITATSAAIVLLAGADQAAAAESKSLCVFDPGGASGDLFVKMQQYQNQAATWGVSLDLKAYTDESVAASDFRNKKCDAVLLTGVTGKEFNRKTYSLEAMGLFTSYAGLKTAIAVLAKPKAIKFNKQGDFETVGIYPGGAVYLHLNDKKLSSLSALSGRSVATIAGDRAAMTMVKEVGATPQSAQISNFASKFNNGGVDIVYSPATAYQPLELYKGVGKGGGVVRFPIAQLTFQIFIRSDEFPAGFGDQSRAYVSGQFGMMLDVIKRAESTITSWIDVDAGARANYKALLATVRSQLVSEKVYNPAVIKLGERIGK